jgi:hypothetical protein
LKELINKIYHNINCGINWLHKRKPKKFSRKWKFGKGKTNKSLTWSRETDEAGALPEGITFDTGTFSTVVLEGGVGSAGEGFDSLADSDFPESNLALFARGTLSSSSELSYKKREEEG